MLAHEASGGCWPTPAQELLLRAGLGTPADARRAWHEWRSTNTLPDAEDTSLWLFPLVYRNLTSADVDPADRALLRGAYRSVWVRNLTMFAYAAEGLRVLAEAGIETIVLKGVALALAHYADAGLRAMGDVDVLVRLRDADRAHEVLSGIGWRRPGDEARRSRTAHSEDLEDDSGNVLDLHWFSLSSAPDDSRFWSRAVELDVLGVPTRSLAPSDQLLHVAAHGARWARIPHVRWMADAAVILRAHGFDWDCLVEEARLRRLTVALEESLAHLHDSTGAEVPERVRAQLRAAPKGRFERRLYQTVVQPSGGGNRALYELAAFNARARLDPGLRLSDYLCDQLAVKHRRELPVRVARKVVQAVLFRVARRAAPGRVGVCPECRRLVLVRRPAGAALCRVCITDGQPASARETSDNAGPSGV